MKTVATLAIGVLCAASLLAEDSPLVKAAKIGAAKRKHVAGKNHVVIDNETVKSTTGHITMGQPVVDLPPLPKAPAPAPKGITSTLSPADREKRQKRITTLKGERA